MNLNATILGQTIAFVIFVLFCMKNVWKPLMAAIDKRQKEIADDLASAERAKKDLDIAKAKAIDYLEKAKLEAQDIIKQAKKHKERIVSEAKTEAEAKRKQILAQAQTEINIEYKRLVNDLRKKAAMLALAGAEKIIEHSINEDISSNIINKIIDKL